MILIKPLPKAHRKKTKKFYNKKLEERQNISQNKYLEMELKKKVEKVCIRCWTVQQFEMQRRKFSFPFPQTPTSEPALERKINKEKQKGMWGQAHLDSKSKYWLFRRAVCYNIWDLRWESAWRYESSILNYKCALKLRFLIYSFYAASPFIMKRWIIVRIPCNSTDIQSSIQLWFWC